MIKCFLYVVFIFFFFDTADWKKNILDYMYLFLIREWMYSASYLSSICSLRLISHLLLSLCQIRISDKRLPPNQLQSTYIIYSCDAIQCIRLTSNLWWYKNVCLFENMMLTLNGGLLVARNEIA